MRPSGGFRRVQGKRSRHVLREVCGMTSQETSKDLMVRTSSFDGVTGTFSIPARTAAVRLGLNPHTPTRFYMLNSDCGALSVRAHSGVHQAATRLK